MPHLIIEYNKGLNQSKAGLDIIEDLTRALHQEAMSIEALPVGGIRIRAYEADHALIGDGDKDFHFIYVTLRLGQGRTETVKCEIGERLFAVVTALCAQRFSEDIGLSLGFEIQEIEKAWTWKQNTIHKIIKDKTDG